VNKSRDANNNRYADNSWDPKNANGSNNIANSGVNGKKEASQPSQAAKASETQAIAQILAAVATSTYRRTQATFPVFSV
jgi:hypothetical protein